MVWFRNPETDPSIPTRIPSHSDDALRSTRFSRQAITGRTGRRDDRRRFRASIIDGNVAAVVVPPRRDRSSAAAKARR